MLALGITLLICIQGLINMAVVTGLLPTKGIALPLVSYGGSSLVITMGGARSAVEYFEGNSVKEFGMRIAESRNAECKISQACIGVAEVLSRTA